MRISWATMAKPLPASPARAASMAALMAIRSVEEEIFRMSLVKTLIWLTLWLFSMAWSSMAVISAVLPRTASSSWWAERSISSARPRISTE